MSLSKEHIKFNFSNGNVLTSLFKTNTKGDVRCFSVDENTTKQLVAPKKSAGITHKVTSTKSPFISKDPHEGLDKAILWVTIIIAVVIWLMFFSQGVPEQFSYESSPLASKDTVDTIWESIKVFFKNNGKFSK